MRLLAVPGAYTNVSTIDLDVVEVMVECIIVFLAKRNEGLKWAKGQST